MNWLRNHVCGGSRRYDRAAEVAVLADEITAHARALNDRLLPIANAPDPITALMADLYNRRERNSIYGKPR